MPIYFLKRILYALPIAFAVSALCFALVFLAPGDPLSAVLPADASQEMIDSVKARYGLDKPLPQQYANWLGRALSGDLGQSISTGREVSAEIGNAIGNSLLLALMAAALAVAVGSAMGVVAGYRIGTPTDKLLSALAISTGIVMRSVRALVADTLKQEFIVGLMTKGLGPQRIFRHVMKNIAPTALAVIGVQLGYLIAGSILVETVFAWPGTGLLLNNAILQRDVPLLQGTILVLATIFVLLNLLVDMLQPLFDPRMTRS